nr:MAG: hypothetical protein [Bacteriophage sp.]
MKQEFNVIHVELRKPYNGNTHYYFGSKAAIYDTLPEELVGISIASLWNVDLTSGEYSNKHCIIRMGKLKRKKQSIKGV